jgi:hypothetical protein
VSFDPVSGDRQNSRLFLGRGVSVADVRRTVDPALQSRLRDGISDQTAKDVSYQLLADIESILNELSDSDLSSELGRFFDSFSSLANSPSSSVSKAAAVEQAVRSAFEREVVALRGKVELYTGFLGSIYPPGTTDLTLRARRHSSDDTASIKVTVRPRAPWWILAVTGGVGAMMLAYLTFLLTGNKMADWKLSVWSPSQKTIPAPKLLNDYWSRTGKVAVVPFSVLKRDPLLSTLKDSTHNLRCARVPAGRNRLPGNVSYDGKRRDDGWSVIDQECSAKRSEWELTIRSAPHSDNEDGKRRIRLEFAEQSRFGEKALLALAWIGVIGANAAVFWWIAGH